MSKSLFVTLSWDKSYTLLVAPVSGRFAVDQNHVGYDLKPATVTDLGGVIVGDNLVITDDGRLSATGSGVAGVSSFNNRVGAITLVEKDISDALGYKPVNYKLPVASEAVLGGVKQGKNVTIAEDGAISVPDAPTPYALPIADKDTLGGVKVGKNLSIDPDGTLNAEGGGGTAGVTSFNDRKGAVKLTAKDVKDVVKIPDPYDLPVASEMVLGGVKVGRNLEVKDDGTLSALDQTYTLTPATTEKLGGIIVGDNLTIDEKGRLSATGGEGGGVISFNGREGRVNLTAEDVEEVQQIASKASLGVIKVGKNLTINPDGTLDADGGGEGGVTSFNERTGDVTLEENDVLPLIPKLKSVKDGYYGLVKVWDNDWMSDLIFDEDGFMYVNPRALIFPEKYEESGLRIIPNGRDICLKPATRDAIGGVYVGEGLNVAFKSIAKDGTISVAVDGLTIKLVENKVTAAVANNQGDVGMVCVAPDGTGQIAINEFDESMALCVVAENIILKDQPRAGGLAVYGDSNLLCVAPATTEKMGGMIVGYGLTIADETDQREGCLDVNVDEETIIVNLDNKLQAIGGVKTFNGRKGTVVLTKKDVTDVVSIPDALKPATAKDLGGIKVGSGLSVTADGTLSANGGGGNASVQIKLPSAYSYSNSPNALSSGGKGFPVRGIELHMGIDPIAKFAGAKCMRAVSSTIDPETVLNTIAMLSPDGTTVTVWQQKATGYNPVKVTEPFALMSVPAATATTTFDLSLYSIDATKQRFCAFAVAGDGGIMAYTAVRTDMGNGSVSIQTEEPVSAGLKAADKNIRVAIVESTDKQRVWAFLFYWTSAGLCATAFDMNRRVFVGKETVIRSMQSGGGEIRVCVGDNMMFVAAPKMNKLIVPCYVSEIGVIASRVNDKNTAAYEIAELAFDPINNALMVFYFYGTDGDTGLPNRAAMELYALDGNGVMRRMSDMVMLNFWAFPKTDYGGSVSLGIVGTGGRYVWALRNPNGQISAAGFSLSAGFKVRSLGDCVIGNSVFTPKWWFVGIIVPWGGDQFQLFALGNEDGLATKYELWYLPSACENNFVGYGLDNDGTVMVKGVWTAPTAMQNLVAGQKYYFKILNNVGTNKTGFELTVDSRSGICAGVAVSNKALLI